MPYLDNDSLESSNNRLITEELDYNIANLCDEFHQLLAALTNEQRGIYDDIITAVENNRGGVFFDYGHGGTGMTTYSRFHIKPDIDVANRGISDSQMLFGGKVVVFGGDFRQILPVIPNASRQDIVNASLTSCWKKCKVLRLTKNMRLTVDGVPSEIEQTRILVNWILNIEEGKERAILAPKHEVIQEINDRLLSLFPGDEKEYLSSDSGCQSIRY
ncbi:uncharacterized protein LOC112504609 [Cynara cardunculus var. scolymus]|uniref:uncharacterized protein LOC112504609 n=1 Tax=Cynara cardunculus var. scolymus TaxID=59895 RepID=UPI000D630B77|nr:uncharacterized protein LOC112504609 [Cynara cardunculus var. scolymus]